VDMFYYRSIIVLSMKENALTSYIKSSFQELTKVVWPTKNQAIRLTIIVLIFCSIIALFLASFDFGFSKLFTYLLNLTA
ncbi:preprotein translocase subunit SecE, partial [Patescibacteria group bacterium]